jgi:hypothetical protein
MVFVWGAGLIYATLLKSVMSITFLLHVQCPFLLSVPFLIEGTEGFFFS